MMAVSNKCYYEDGEVKSTLDPNDYVDPGEDPLDYRVFDDKYEIDRNNLKLIHVGFHRIEVQFYSLFGFGGQIVDLIV